MGASWCWEKLGGVRVCGGVLFVCMCGIDGDEVVFHPPPTCSRTSPPRPNVQRSDLAALHHQQHCASGRVPSPLPPPEKGELTGRGRDSSRSASPPSVVPPMEHRSWLDALMVL